MHLILRVALRALIIRALNYRHRKFPGWYFEPHLRHTRFSFWWLLCLFHTGICVHTHVCRCVCWFIGSLACLEHFLKASHIALDKRYWSHQAFCLSVYVNAAGRWAVFNACRSSVPAASTQLQCVSCADPQGFDFFPTDCSSDRGWVLKLFQLGLLLLIWSLAHGRIWAKKYSIVFWLSLSLFVSLCLRTPGFTRVSISLPLV